MISAVNVQHMLLFLCVLVKNLSFFIFLGTTEGEKLKNQFEVVSIHSIVL